MPPRKRTPHPPEATPTSAPDPGTGGAPLPGTETSFRETAERLRLIIESMPDYAIFMLDREGRVLTWNAGAERIKGYRAEEIVGQSFSRFYTAEDLKAEKPAMALQVAAATGRSEAQGWRVRKDGTRFWAHVIITALRGPDGAVVAFGKVTRELTDQRQADATLRQSEERLRLMVENVKEYALLMLDREGRVVSWNAGAERIKGYRAEEIVGRHFSRFYPPDDAAQGRPEWELERAVREGQFEDEGWRIRKDGSRFWANVVIRPIRDAHGNVVGFAKVTRDLTERRRSEGELRRQKGFVEQLINSSDDGIFAFDQDLRYTLWSQGMARITGLSADEAVGRLVLDVFPFFRDTGEDKHFAAALEGRMVTAQGGRYRAVGGAPEATFEARYSPLIGPSGEIIGGLAIVRDETARVAAERELARSNAELERFSYSVSHDLRAPLRAIDGFAKALDEDYGATLTGDGQRLLGVIRDNAQRMGLLIDSLLNFSRLGRRPLVTAPVDLTALAQAVVAELRVAEGGAAVEVAVQSLPPTVGDATLLRQVFANLVANAFKFSRHRAHPRVEIGSQRAGAEVAYFVRDNGAGFDMRFVDKLFGVFQRLHHVEEFEGTGVGLALAGRIVERHGGRMWAEGKVNAGATFYFTLPRAAPTPNR
jgi:PAS domain S-box-containing protein